MTGSARLAPTGDGVAESRTLAPLGRRLASVTSVEGYGAYQLLSVTDHQGPPDPEPGQFYMLAAAERWGSESGRPYLPRAFSHARVTRRGERTQVAFLLEAVGPGTERLAVLRAGEELWLAGPFGVGFRAGSSAATDDGGAARPPAPPVLVGGGIGVAPILALADELGSEARVLLGFRSAAHAAAADLFPSAAAVATDDGSRGRHALVTELLREELDRSPDSTVFACGPPPMLESVRALCAARDTPARLALESGMACGYGACFGCVVPTRDGFVRLCLDGPVLDADRLETALFEGAGH